MWVNDELPDASRLVAVGGDRDSGDRLHCRHPVRPTAAQLEHVREASAQQNLPRTNFAEFKMERHVLGCLFTLRAVTPSVVAFSAITEKPLVSQGFAG